MDSENKKKYLLDIGRQIKQLRISKGISQEALANKCGYTSRSSINKIELGLNDIPQSKIKSLAEALGVSPSSLMSLEDSITLPTIDSSISNIIDNILDFTEREFVDLQLAIDLIKARRNVK